MIKLASKVYGDMLFEAAQDMGSINATYEEVLAPQSIWQEQSDFMQLLNHPQIVKKEKVQVIKDVFDGKAFDGVMGFSTTIAGKGRQQSIPDIFVYFIDKVKEHKEIDTAYVTSAVELSGTQKSQVKERLLVITVYKELKMNYTVDESPIGGMVICIGDRVVDSSIKTQLHELKKSLLNVQMVQYEHQVSRKEV